VTNVVSIHNLRESGEDLQEGLEPDERNAKLLEAELPYICNDIAMLIGRPFRLIWDPELETASTDCIAEVRVAPWPFLEGQRDVGFGTIYHETGHIRQSPYGARLLERAQEEGGDTLQHLLNIILDRKDDYGTAEHAPGFAETLRRRLLYICTLTRRRKYQKLFAGKSGEEIARILRHIKPGDPYEDFFFAAKWHKSPRFQVTTRAMKLLRQRQLRKAGAEELLWTAKRVREILGEIPGREQNERGFNKLYAFSGGVECNGKGEKLDPKLSKAISKMMARYVASIRKGGMSQLVKFLKSAGMVWPGPLSVGRTNSVPVERVAPSPGNIARYQGLLEPIRPQVGPLVRRLKRIDNPSEYTLYGREEGRLDLSASARIATGLSGCYLEVVLERDIDAEVHLAIDCSGSMGGKKVKVAKQIGVAFSEAINSLEPMCTGRTWAFNSKAISDFGKPSSSSGFVTIEGSGGNSDTHMLAVVGKELAKSHKRRKVLLVLCDDGPDDMALAKQLSQQLMARGIIVIHLLVGVHGTPDIYPVELLYTSMEECLLEFGDLLETIIKNLK